MNTLKFFAQVGIFLFFTYQPAVHAGSDQDLLNQYPNYVVIGAFSVHNNAIKFTRIVKKHNLEAKFEMNPNRQLYYVYVLSTSDREKAMEEARRLRKETEFADAWVYNGLLGVADLTSTQAHGIDINPVTEKKMASADVGENLTASLNTEAKKENSSSDHTNETVDTSVNTVVENNKTPAEQQKTSANDPQKTSSGDQIAANGQKISTPTTDQNKISDEVEGKPVYFKLYRAMDNELVNGEVDIIDADRSRKVGSYQGNSIVKIPSPANKSGEISVVCEVFGYRKVQRTLNYINLTGEDIALDENGNPIIPFELVRLQKGDIAVMYNVYFFKDAGVMRPESRYEVNSLLDMLKENPNYKIKIHGHTNGGAAGRILSMGESKNFFSLTDTKEGVGSAKKLSEERARVIREYLVSSGIEEKRMEIKAWGGKRPIHDKHHTRAAENVRVEIEILEN